GTDFEPFTEVQYQSLTYLTNLLIIEYPLIKNNITGHSNIAPGRKTDPGPFFDWTHYKSKLNN
ncbi:1,6-anhydro-N-acetylmuramyl-L-alanine amidase AmpD, partial [Escherichia coli]|nr:1,6-anhydro-N-acetylmuramyl-L-alanine amidase AmpD [Escherichia coli]